MNQKYTVEFKASDVSQLLFLNLLWPIIAWWVYRDSKKAIFDHNPKYNYKMIWDYIFLILIFFFIVSNTCHVVVNRINGTLLYQEYIRDVILFDPEHGMSAGYLLIYYYDEYLGHLGMMAPLFFGQLVIFRNQLKNPQYLKDIHLIELMLLVILAIGGGLFNSYSLMEGQSNIPLLVLHLLIIPLFLWLLFGKKFKFKENPMFLFFLLQTVGFLIYSIIWIAMTGLKPYYPFTYQPSELNHPWI
jgi:uncharacterized integral membrane protein